MANYDFLCKNCDVIWEITIPFSEVKNNPDWNKKCCKDCNKELEVYLGEANLIIIQENSERLKYAPISSHAEDWKKKQHQKLVEHISQEGWHSNSELREAYDVAKEEEKKLGKTEGSLTGGVKASVTPQEKEAVRKRDLAKKNDQVRMRKRLI